MLPVQSDPSSGILPGGQTLRVAAAGKQIVTCCTSNQAQVRIERPPSLLCQFEPNGPTGLLLPHSCSVKCVAMWRDVGLK